MTKEEVMTDQKLFLTPAEAAQRLGISRWTLARMDLSPIRPNPNGHRRYPVAEIERLARQI